MIIDRVLLADEARALFLIFNLKEALAQEDLKRDRTEDLAKSNNEELFLH